MTPAESKHTYGAGYPTPTNVKQERRQNIKIKHQLEGGTVGGTKNPSLHGRGIGIYSRARETEGYGRVSTMENEDQDEGRRVEGLASR